MTPEERAEKIHKETGCVCVAPKYCACVELILAEIREAVDDDRCQRSAGDLYKHSYNRGKAEAYEDAAKIIYEHSFYCSHVGANVRKLIEKIRARARIPLGTPHGTIDSDHNHR